MSPLWSFLVSIGEWVQRHPTLLVYGSAALVLVLGAVRMATRAASHHGGRPR
jgi:hypothetical protein